MVKVVCLDDVFSGIFKLGAGMVEGHSLQQKEKKRTKDKTLKKLNTSSLKILISVHAVSKDNKMCC